MVSSWHSSVHTTLVTPLYLTNNPNLASTSRILQAWVGEWQAKGVTPAVVVQKEGAFPAWLRAEGVPCLVDPMPWLDKRRPWQAIGHAWRVANWARKQGVRVIHCNEHDVYPFALLVRRWLRRPMVCHVRYRLDRGFAEWCLRDAKQPDALLWTSHQQREDSLDAISGLVDPHRQHVVRLGIDVQRCDGMKQAGRDLRRELGIAEEALVVGTASPLRPRKRVHDFVTLIERLANQNRAVVGLIAGGEVPGDEAYRARIEREVEQSGLGDRLRLLGNVDPIEPFHHVCDVSVSTSEYETFGNSVCEAMACGVTVVAYDGGSVAEVVGETGRIVGVGDLPSLEAAVTSLLNDAQLRDRLGQAAKDRVGSEFDPRKSFEQVREIYDRLTSPHALTHRQGVKAAL